MRTLLFVVLCAAAISAFDAGTAATPPMRELRPFDAKSPDAIRKAHAGKAFILALWSIHCEPCREEMAEWNALRRKHPQIPIVLVSSDVPAERAQVLEFLTRYDPGPVEAWMFADEFSERVRYAIDRNWRGELPRTYLFDARHRADVRSGRLDKRWIDAWLARQ